mmetsp:Transcript_96323/g.171157  ORF Transcript_96323/g.171157 Transcript_96323/m.171157 type:complete len:634 (-) Transcript_96323:376-2277(-)
MGCCSSTARTTAGSRKKLPEVSWHCGVNYCHGLEVEGIPLDRYLEHFSGLGRPEQHQVVTKVVEEASTSAASGARAGVCHTRTAKIGLLSWNVGGISDHRKDQGAGLEEAVQGAAAEVLSAAVADLGPADVIVVGLQEIISLTPSNAMKGTSSANESRKNKSFYGWPETVAQWVELLAGGLNGQSSVSQDHPAYVLYGQPVYLFGLLLCVFCPASMLKHIRDFGMAEKPLDQKWKSGAKGAVACRFVLWDRSFCFLNCHLAATTATSAKSSLRTFKQRLQQLEQCWNEIKFKSHVNQMVYPVSAHRAIFLLGDTNMRLVNNYNCHQACQDFHSYTTNAIGDAEAGYRELWELDQLTQELSKPDQPSISERPLSGCLTGQLSEGILKNWQEPLVDENLGPPFPPTFKLAVPGPGYSRKRVPAWTDRVLFRSDHAEPAKYGSVMQSKVLKPPRNLSDHDPVYAFFNVECTSIHPRRLGSLAREVRKASMGLDERKSQPPAATRRFPSTQQAQQAALASGSMAAHEEEFSRRLSERLSELEDPSDTAAASWLLQECQEECWMLLCRRLEFSLNDSIRPGLDLNWFEDVPGEREAYQELDAEELAKSLQEVMNTLRRDLVQNTKPKMSKSSSTVVSL